MIRTVLRGSYKLVETKNRVKILTLDEDTYAWVNTEKMGELLVSSSKAHFADTILGVGKYRLYDVANEPKITDLYHLELLVGAGVWQGFLLPGGLPDLLHKRVRIIPTQELITQSAVKSFL